MKIYIELAEKFHQSGLQFVSSLTKYKDVLQSQNDDLQKKVFHSSHLLAKIIVRLYHCVLALSYLKFRQVPFLINW